MKKIKIMLVTRSLNFGGLERVVINLWKFMDREIFDPFIVCTVRPGAYCDEVISQGGKVYVLESKFSKYDKFLVPFKLAKISRKEDVDVVHTHNSGPMIDSSLAKLFFLKGKLIHTDHARVFPDKYKYMAAEFVFSHFYKNIIAVSSELKRNLNKYEKISLKKLSVINNGIDGDYYQSSISVTEAKSRFGLSHFSYVVGLAVVLSKQKGIIHLIDAASDVLKIRQDIGFVVGGDGPIRQELEQVVQERGLANNFKFIGARKDIPDFLKALDIYVLPSEWEGLPLVLLEAMAAKKCIIATSVGGIPDLINDGHDGLLVQSKDHVALSSAIMYILNNKKLISVLGENALNKFNACYGVTQMVKLYENIYLS